MTFGGTMDFHFVAGDTNSKLQVTCKRTDTGAVIDVTTATVTLRWSVNEGTTTEDTMTKEDAVNGIVSYTWGTDELEAGILKCEVEIDSGGNVVTSLEAMRFSVRDRLP
jgi:hypothetical protein